MTPAVAVQGGTKAPAFPLWERVGCFAIAFWICSELSRHLSMPVFSYVPLWLPAGLYAAVLLLHETRTWGWFLLAGLLANAAFDLPAGSSPAVFAGFYCANTLEALVAAWLMRRFVSATPRLENLKEFLGLLVFMTGIGPMVGALIGAATLVWAGMNHSFYDAWSTWVLNTALAMGLVTPFILVWANRSAYRQPLFGSAARMIEAVVLVALLSGYTYYLLVVDKGITVPYKSRLMPLLLWAGLRFGLRGMTAANLGFALWTTFLTTHYMRGLTPGQIADGSYVPVLQSFIAMSILIAFVPTVVLVQRDQHLRELAESEQRARTLTEAALQEVTSRKHAELALLDEQALSDAVINALPGIFYMFDANGRLVRWNEEFARVVGGTRKEVANHRILDCIANEDLDATREAVKRAYAEGQMTVEARARTSAGVRWFHFEARRLQIGPQMYLVGTGSDVTERRQAEMALRQYEEALKQSNDGIALADLEGRFTFVNDAWADMHGFEKSDLVGQPLAIVHTPEQMNDYYALSEIVARSGHGQREVGHKRKDGTCFPTWMSVTLVRGPDGKVAGLLSIANDITAQKQMDTQLLRVQRQETIGTLASGIAHDLNNMLSPILAGLNLLHEDVTKPETRRLLELMENSVERGAGVIKQLLLFGRGAEPKRAPLNPVRPISEITKIIRETFPKNLQLETSCADRLWLISADATQIYQVLLNLAVNARDAMAAGGTLSISAENVSLVEPPVFAAHARAGNYVLITVSDTGMGMLPEVLDRIFEPFYTTKELGKGTGLGLAVVIGVVENHGGFIHVQSKPGEGSQFKVYLPALSSQAGAGDTEAKPELPRGKGELVLLVDDEPAILKVTAKILEKHGYRTVAANGGADALKIYEDNPSGISAVISDLSMPGMDGLALAATLSGKYGQSRIIIASGLGDTLDSVKLQQLGVDQILKKPFTTEAVLAALRRMLSTT